MSVSNIPRTILVVDDDPVIRDMMVDIFSFEEYPIVVARNGREALVAAESLRATGTRLGVVDLPWLNRFDLEWLAEAVAPHADVFVLEDHAPVGGLGDALRRELSDAGLIDGRSLTVFGVDGWPACGTPPEVLRFHQLDGGSLAKRIAERLGVRSLS